MMLNERARGCTRYGVVAELMADDGTDGGTGELAVMALSS